MNMFFRRVILAAATNPVVRRFVNRYGMRLGGARFVAGETLDEAIPVLRRLDGQGLETNTTLLGEHVEDEADTLRVVEAYEAVLDRIGAEGLRTNVALKLTHLGLDLDEELACSNVARLLERAGRHGNFIRIDMEESTWVDATLRIFRRLREAGHENVGTVLQAYLYRTETDLERLLDLQPRLRIVKGAYLEPDTIAYPQKPDVDAAYERLIDKLLGRIPHLAVATQDERLIQHTIERAREDNIPNDRFQFQMLYGIRPQLQLELAQQGYSVLVATPYGPDWYPYLTRRLAERPANLLFIANNLRKR